MALPGTRVSRAQLGHGSVTSLLLTDRALSSTWDFPKPPPCLELTVKSRLCRALLEAGMAAHKDLHSQGKMSLV